MNNAGNPYFTEDVFNEIKEKLMDENFISKYGTSVSMNMGREYQIYLQENYDRLKNEFDKINKNPEDGITKEELKEFLRDRRRGGGKKYSDKEIDVLFALIDIDKNSEITIKEFVISYMILEEKIRLTKFKYQKQIEDFNESKENYSKLANENKDESLNIFGVADNAELKVSLIEASDVGNNCYAILSLEQDKQNSTLRPNSANPVWNEEFKFKPNSKDRALLIDIYEKSELGYDNFKGQASIPLRDLESQIKYDEWYSLFNKDGSSSNGKVHIRVQFIWSKFTYYQELISKIEKRILSLNEKMEELNQYFDLFKTPFGLILYADIEDLLEKKLLNRSEDIMAGGMSRKSVFLMSNINPNKSLSPRNNNTGIRYSLTNDSVLKGLANGPVFNFTLLLRILMGIMLVNTILTLLGRSDFLNLLAGVSVWIIHSLYKNQITRNPLYVKQIWIFFIATCVYDLIWFFTSYEGIFKRDFDMEINSLQQLSLVFSILNLGTKLGFIVLLYMELSKK